LYICELYSHLFVRFGIFGLSLPIIPYVVTANIASAAADTIVKRYRYKNALGFGFGGAVTGKKGCPGNLISVLVLTCGLISSWRDMRLMSILQFVKLLQQIADQASK
jgi:hypothetical protein